MQASAAEARSQPSPYPSGPTMYPVHSPGPQQPTQPFVFAPHRLTPLPPQLAPYQHHHHIHQQHQGTPQQHSLSRALSAEAESPGEGQVYSLRSRVAPRAEPSALDQPHAQLQKLAHKVHHFFMCHTDQVCSPFLTIHTSVILFSVECLRTVTLQHVCFVL